MHKGQRKKGFTIPELLGILVILAIIAGLAVPLVRSIKDTAQEKSAIGQAQAINAAKLAYRDKVINADTTWAAANNDTRYTLLISNSLLPMSASTLSAYTPTGYSYNLGLLTEKTTVQKNGQPLTY